MSSKVVLLLGLSLAVFLLIASEVTARELAETTTTTSLDTKGAEKANEVAEDEGHGDGRGGYNRGGSDGHGGYNYGGGYGHGGHGGGGYGHGGHGGGGYCKYSCCKYYYGHCKRCCAYKGEAMDAAEP